MSQQEHESLVPAGFGLYYNRKKQISGKIQARFEQDYRAVSTKNECRNLQTAVLIFVSFSCLAQEEQICNLRLCCFRCSFYLHPLIFAEIPNMCANGIIIACTKIVLPHIAI